MSSADLMSTTTRVWRLKSQLRLKAFYFAAWLNMYFLTSFCVSNAACLLGYSLVYWRLAGESEELLDWSAALPHM